jgi:serine protease Do
MLPISKIRTLRKATMRTTNIIKTRILLILVAVFALATIYVLADLTPAQLENGKKATALVQINTIKNKVPTPGGRGAPFPPGIPTPTKKARVNGTAFCINPEGWFVTCSHVTEESADGKVKLILNAGEKDQTILEAKLIRSNKDRDLALLKVNNHAPFAALQLGSIEGLVETARLAAFGYPFGEDLALNENTFPAISISPGAITSLRKKDGQLETIQLDASLNPGNSGGPVLNSEGRVIGIVNAGIEGAAVNFAIPVSHLQEFLSAPEVEFILPTLTPENMHKTATFKASVLAIIGKNEDYQAELTLTVAGVKRKVPMKRGADGFFAEEVPVPPQKGPISLSITAVLGSNSVSGTIVDKSFSIAGKTYQLSKVQRLEGGAKPSVVLDDGTKVEGTINGLSSVSVNLDAMQVTLDLTKATSVTFRIPAVADAVDYQLAVSMNGKTVKTDSGVIPITHIASKAANVSTLPNAAGTTAPDGMPKREVKLPSDIYDVAVGGGGRFLILHMRKLRQLAIFDTSAAKVVKYLPMDSENILFTAGAEKLLVASTDPSIISRYNLQTFEREVTAPMPVTGTINAMVMGSNSRGPLLVSAATGAGPKQTLKSVLSLIDPNTLAVKNASVKGSDILMISQSKLKLRASADGTLFCMWNVNGSPSGLQTMVTEGNDARTWFLQDNLTPAVPSPDGRVIYTPRGNLSPELNTSLGPPPMSIATSNTRIPATQGSIYLDIDPAGRISVMLAGESRVLTTLPPIGDSFGAPEGGPGAFPPSIMRSPLMQNDPLDRDKLLHLIPDAHLIIAIPKTKDRLILQPFDLLQVLKDSKIDYLFVLSSPVASAAKGSNYLYQIQVESKRGGVKYSLESGPAGMKITPAGKLTWTAGAAQSEETVIVRITDSSGQEIFHTFRISVK